MARQKSNAEIKHIIIRLPLEEYKILQKLAEDDFLAPTTKATQFVRRGIRDATE